MKESDNLIPLDLDNLKGDLTIIKNNLIEENYCKYSFDNTEELIGTNEKDIPKMTDNQIKFNIIMNLRVDAVASNCKNPFADKVKEIFNRIQLRRNLESNEHHPFSSLVSLDILSDLSSEKNKK